MANDNKTETTSKKSKKLFTILITLTTIFILLFVALMIYYFGASYKEFDSLSQKEFAIPGLNTNFTPQGMAYDSSNKRFIISGYCDKGESKLYIVNKRDKSVEFETIVTYNGEAITSHFGGVAVYNSTLYIAGEEEVFCVSLDAIYNPIVEGSVEAKGKFSVPNNTAFLTIYNDHLIVGEFYNSTKYKTDASHHIKVSETEENRALALAYKIDDKSDDGISSVTPKYAISLGSQVQGMSLNDAGEWVFSTSYGLADSKIKIYSNPLNKDAASNIDVGGKSIPLYIFSNSLLTRTITAPCMAEEIVLVDKRIYVLFENNCSKYRLFTRTRLSNVYSLDI